MAIGLRLDITRTDVFGRTTSQRSVILDGGGIFHNKLFDQYVYRADCIQIDHDPKPGGNSRIGLRLLPFFGNKHYEVKGVSATDEIPGVMTRPCQNLGKVQVRISRVDFEKPSNVPIFGDQ